MPNRVSVVIVGAGPTGLTAANLLGMAGIETLVIERNGGVYEFPRAIAIDDEGLRVCQSIGLANDVLAHIRFDVKAHYVSQGRFLARVEPTGRRNGYPLVSTFHQPTFERILLTGTERFSAVTILFQHTLEVFEQDEEAVSISIRTPAGSLAHVKCDYLLACDGGKSPIRRALNIPLSRGGACPHPRTIDTGQKWLVVDCISESEPSNAIIFFCNPARPAVSVPGPGNQRRWEFMLLLGEREETLLQNDTIHTLIRHAWRSIPRGHYLPGTQSLPTFQITRQTIYTFHALTAPTFSRGRVFLLGDSAHLMPPFGGQGMNAGLRDAHNLCWKLQLVLQKQAHPSLLASYHLERHPHASQMVLFSWLLGKIIMPTRRLIAFLRDIFLHTIDKIPPIQEAIKEMRVKPQPRYKRGLLLPHNGAGHKLIGTLLPQPPVLTFAGKRVLLDDILGNGFALLRLHEDPLTAFEELRHEIWTRLGVRFVCIQPAHSRGQRYHDQHLCVVDIDQQLSTFLSNKRDLYILVRPDRYVMGVFRVGQAQQFELALQGLMI